MKHDFTPKPAGACGAENLNGIAFQDEDGRFVRADTDVGRKELEGKLESVPLCKQHFAEHQKLGHAVSLFAPVFKGETPFWKGTVCHFTAAGAKKSAPPVAISPGGKVPVEPSDTEDTKDTKD